MRNIEVKEAYCLLNMRRIILVASLLAVIGLAGSSILELLEQRSVNTAKSCFDVGGSLAEELLVTVRDFVDKCEVPKVPDIDGDILGKYLDYDIINDQLTCKKNAPEKCRASVQEFGRVLDKIWHTNPSVCEDYELLKAFVVSCN